MRILDIHTHVLPDEPGTALVCAGCGPLPQGDGNWFSVGLHPWDISEDADNQLRPLDSLVANPRVLAVGECGFDTLRGPSRQLQEQVFIHQVALSERYAKPMILHVVRDFDSVIRLRRQLRPTQPWLVHGFRGGPEQMNQLYSQGILVSFGPKHNPESLRTIPSDRLFLETDGVGTINDVIFRAADIRGTTPETVELLISCNTDRFL